MEKQVVGKCPVVGRSDRRGGSAFHESNERRQERGEVCVSVAKRDFVVRPNSGER